MAATAMRYTGKSAPAEATLVRELRTAAVAAKAFLTPCTDPNIVPVGNGLFDFASKRLIPFTPDLVFTWESPIDFDLAAAEFAVKRDGTAIIAKSNDYQAVWPNYVEVTERAEDEPGRTMPIDNGKTVLAPSPTPYLT